MAISPVVRDNESAHFFDGVAEGRFLLGMDRATGECFAPRTEREDLASVPAAGTGKVISWAIVHGRAMSDEQAARTVVGIVELDEGPWWWCQITGVDPSADLSGLPVQMTFVPSGPEAEHEMVPVFGPRIEKTRR
jgi:uncharacterized OB-fold protein